MSVQSIHRAKDAVIGLTLTLVAMSFAGCVSRFIETPVSIEEGESWTVFIDRSEGDYAYAVTEVADGGVVMVGTQVVYVDGIGEAQIYAVKLSAVGELLWEFLHGSQSANEISDVVEPTADGGVIMACSWDGFRQAKLIKLSTDGTVQFELILSVDAACEVNDICPTDDGGYLCVGYSLTDVFDYDQMNGFATKVSHGGAIEWSRSFTGEGGIAINAALETDSGFVLAGFQRRGGPPARNSLLLLTDSLGHVVASDSIPGLQGEMIEGMAPARFGQFACYTILEGSNLLYFVDADLKTVRSSSVGITANYMSFTSTADNGFAFAGACWTYPGQFGGCIARLNNVGTVVWDRVYPEANEYNWTFEAVTGLADGGLVACGEANQFNYQGIALPQIIVVRTDAEGYVDPRNVIRYSPVGATAGAARRVIDVPESDCAARGLNETAPALSRRDGTE